MSFVGILTVLLILSIGLLRIAESKNTFCFNGGVLNQDGTCLCPPQYEGDVCQTGNIYLSDDNSIQINFPTDPTHGIILVWHIVVLCSECGLNLQVPIMPELCATISIYATLNSSVNYFNSVCSNGELVYSDSQMTTVTYVSAVQFPVADKIIINKAETCAQTGCKNSGNCVHDNTQRTFCKCDKGYGGVQCQIDEYCGKNPCKNGGTCSHGDDGPSCSCAKNVQGKFCNKGYCNDFVDASDYPTTYSSPLYPSGDFEFTSCNVTIKVLYPNEVVQLTVTGATLSVAADHLDIYQVVGDKAESLASIDYHDMGAVNTTLQSKLGVVIVNFNSYYPYDGFTLTYHEVSVNYCDNITCLNNGTCGIDSHKGFCYCEYPYYGQFCQNQSNDICIEIHEPCLHNGTCHHTNGENYTCTCLPEYTGPQCQYNVTDEIKLAPEVTHFKNNTSKVDECHQRCFHGGVCLRTGRPKPMCACPEGFNGERCEMMF